MKGLLGMSVGSDGSYILLAIAVCTDSRKYGPAGVGLPFLAVHRFFIAQDSLLMLVFSIFTPTRKDGE
jgi:hypothetical protein